MWGFSWLKGAFSRADQSVDGMLAARLEALEKSQTDLRMMRLEWAEVLDKLTAWTNRQSARDAKYLKTGLIKLTEDAPGPTNSEDPTPSTPMTKVELRRALAARNQRNHHIGG